jgi:hypothetical protein
VVFLGHIFPELYVVRVIFDLVIRANVFSSVG